MKGINMKEQVKIAIAEKVKLGAFNCHYTHKTSLVRCEEQYVEYYAHCLEYFGCEITRNTYDKYLGFIVYDPSRIELDVQDCVDSYTPPVKKESKLKLGAIHYLLIGYVFGFIIAVELMK